MKILILGGTGTISTGITKQLLVKDGVEVIHFNRGRREKIPGVDTIVGDRKDTEAFERQMKELGAVDCVIDMIGFTPEEAHSAVRVFHGRIGQYLFCSTVDVYAKGADRYPSVESHERAARPSFQYAYHKLQYENIIMGAHDPNQFPVTIIRPAQTYGGDGYVVTSLGSSLYAMKRLRERRPIIVHGDGNSLWTACHRDDVARAFVNAVGNASAVGKAYHVTGEEWMTHNGYWRTVAKALGESDAQTIHIPTDLLGRILPEHARWCVENFQYNHLFDNRAARQDLGFLYTISWEEGIRSVIAELDRRGMIELCGEEPYYDAVLEAWDRLGTAMTAALQSFR